MIDLIFNSQTTLVALIFAIPLVIILGILSRAKKTGLTRRFIPNMNDTQSDAPAHDIAPVLVSVSVLPLVDAARHQGARPHALLGKEERMAILMTQFAENCRLDEIDFSPTITDFADTNLTSFPVSPASD